MVQGKVLIRHNIFLKPVEHFLLIVSHSDYCYRKDHNNNIYPKLLLIHISLLQVLIGQMYHPEKLVIEKKIT